MDALECINSRRSIRKYKNKTIPSGIVRKLIIAGMNAPSAYNSQPWIFILIKNQKTKNIIIEAKGGSQFIMKAPLIIACCYDENKSPDKYHNIENVSLAAENILLAAHVLRLGACYIGAFDPENLKVEKKISEALNLPKNVHLVSLISIGYPDELPKSKKMKKYSEVIRIEHY
ncbi:MAG: nitroreductase family protein [Candidatus Nanoarchaeia archaeon]|nr:nitroreductase family protein [Candidatus Nanoarchaeia archaeon]